MVTMKNIVWTEKYRPVSFEDIIGQDVKRIKDLVDNPLTMPNFLFVSRSPGTGKTSMANVIRHTTKTKDFLSMNASDDRKIETIRSKVKTFCETMRRDKTTKKIILMDEFDGMLTPSQEALRGIMEKYQKNVCFILTANDESDIISPIKSRCTTVRFVSPPKDDMCDRLAMICNKENVQHTAEGILNLVNAYYPDMRTMINEVQLNAKNGITTNILKRKTDLEDEFYVLLKRRNPYEARKFLIDNKLNPHDLLKRTMENIISIEKDATPQQLKDIMWFIAEINYRMCIGADSEIQMFAFIIKWLDVFK